MKNIFSHPLTQIICFGILLINGKEWSLMPYGWFVVFGTADGQLFAIIGAVAVLIALVSCFLHRDFLQPLSLLLMWASILTFLWQITESNKLSVFKGAPGLATALLFVAGSVLVFKEKMVWKKG